MVYNFDFEICAILILFVVIAFNYAKKSLPLLQNHLYFCIVWTVFFTTIFEFLSAISEMYNYCFPKWSIYLINCVFYALINAIPVLYIFYCLAMTDIFEKKSLNERKKLVALILIPIAISYLLIILTPILSQITVLTFSVDETNVYHRGGFWFYFLYLIAFCYFVASFIILVRHEKTITRKRMLTTFSFIIFSFIAVAIQLLVPSLLVQCFGISFAVLFFSFTVQKPENRLDTVTDLYNQTGFATFTNKQFVSKKSFYCAGITLDDMTFMINTFGIKIFNSLLYSVANFLSQYSKVSTAYHLSQGRFCLVFSEYSLEKKIDDTKTEAAEAQRIISEILTRFQKKWVLGNTEYKLNIRTCLIHCPEDADSSESIIDLINQVAEEDRFKKGGLVHAKTIDTDYKKRIINIEYILRNAFRKKAFQVYYQPIYSTKKKRIIGAEALIRLKDVDGKVGPAGKFISPEEFIPIAEKNGTIFSIGEYVFEEVCKMLNSINPDKYGIEKIDINLSIVQCMQSSVTDQIITIADIYQIPHHLLNLEITETAAAYSQTTLIETMEKLAKTGIEFSLDDYGSGHATMEYMLDLPFKMIKIDKGIIWNAFANPRINVALASTIAMIGDLDMLVLAEGVETKEQVDWLSALGCDYLQGYYFSKPLPKDNYLQLMKRANPESWAKYSNTEEIEELEELEEID